MTLRSILARPTLAALRSCRIRWDGAAHLSDFPQWRADRLAALRAVLGEETTR